MKKGLDVIKSIDDDASVPMAASLRQGNLPMTTTKGVRR